jgi:hypothetical protein
LSSSYCQNESHQTECSHGRHDAGFQTVLHVPIPCGSQRGECPITDPLANLHLLTDSKGMIRIGNIGLHSGRAVGE